MTPLRAIAYAALGLVIVVTGLGLVLPREVSVERSIVIAAPPEAVFAHVNSLRRFNAWSPWYAMEPDAAYVLEGPEEGVGATSRWKGEKVGTGSMVIIESVSPAHVRTALDFGAEGTANAEWRLEAVEGGTRITWGFTTDLGANPFGRYFGLMMDGWIGADYEKGLARLKSLVETGALPPPGS